MTKVNKDKCTGCGRCVQACTKYLFTIKDGVAVCDDSDCFECGHCGGACPFGAIEYDWTKASVGDKIEFATEKDFEKVIYSRRSIRHYKSDPVDKKTLERLVFLANQAPTGSNQQGVKYIITTPETTAKLEAAAQRAVPLSNDYIKNSAPNKREGITLGAPHVVCIVGNKYLGGHNAAIAACALDLAAEPLGLGCCYNGILVSLYFVSDEMKEIVGLSPDEKMYMMLSVGYKGDESYVNKVIRPAPETRYV
ncbi:MAG: nitroreductase family protein [Clostridia bacterium]|nr:nitroreductase family protein [Clostridia bacterium]